MEEGFGGLGDMSWDILKVMFHEIDPFVSWNFNGFLGDRLVDFGVKFGYVLSYFGSLIEISWLVIGCETFLV